MTTNNSSNTAIPSGVSAGSYTTANITVNAAGQVTAASNGSSASGTVTSVATGLGITGGTITSTGTLVSDLTVNTQRAYCVVATTANLTSTYSNGSSGVGATLTNSSTQVALTIDGILQVVGNRVLVKSQSTHANNGIYTVSTVGDGATNWVLTRATDFDGAIAGGIAYGVTIWIAKGTINAGSLWMQTDAGPWTIGTTAIDFTAWLPGSGNSTSGFVFTASNGSSPVWAPPFLVNGGNVSFTGSTTITPAGIYVSNVSGTPTYTLPSSPSGGDCYLVSGGGGGSTGKWIIAVSGSQKIVQGPLTCTVGTGTVSASHKFDSALLMYMGGQIFNIIFSSSAGLIFT